MLRKELESFWNKNNVIFLESLSGIETSNNEKHYQNFVIYKSQIRIGEWKNK